MPNKYFLVKLVQALKTLFIIMFAKLTTILHLQFNHLYYNYKIIYYNSGKVNSEFNPYAKKQLKQLNHVKHNLLNFI